MNTAIRQLIRRYHGYVYESAGLISAFFDDAHAAHDCADQLGTLVHDLHRLGSQITFAV